MFELKIYSNDVHRYTIIGDWDKVNELRNRGYYVQVRLIPRAGSRMQADEEWDSFMLIEHDGIIFLRNDEYDEHILAEVRPDAGVYALDYY